MFDIRHGERAEKRRRLVRAVKVRLLTVFYLSAALVFSYLMTWVSLEPVYYPGHTFAIIHETCEFVDEYKIGKLNYHPQSKNVDWVKFAREISDFLDEWEEITKDAKT
jgi:hypothetical protein